MRLTNIFSTKNKSEYKHPDHINVYIGKSPYNEMYYDIKKDGYETFGIFLGRKIGNDYYISHIVDEGVDARRSVAQIEFDDRYVNYRLKRLMNLYNVEFLGIYHKHPSGVERFSHPDFVSMDKFFQVVKQPYLSFLAFDTREGIEFIPFIYNGKEALPVQVNMYIEDDNKVLTNGGIEETAIHYSPEKVNLYISRRDMKKVLQTNQPFYFQNIGNEKNIVVAPAQNPKDYIVPIGRLIFRVKANGKFYLVNKEQIKLIDPDQIKKRTEGIISLNKMADKSVLIVGAGSVGSTVVVNLARLGVGTIDIVDFDAIEPHNPFRHELGLESIGLPKVKALQKKMAQINPFITVNGYNSSFEDFVSGAYLREKKKYDLIISAVDNRVDQLDVSKFAEDTETKYINISLHPGGGKGEIFVYIPGKTGNYEDLLHAAGISMEELKKESSQLAKRFYVDEASIDEEAIPVIYPQVLRIVSTGVELSVKLLEGKDEDMEKIKASNLWIVENEIWKLNTQYYKI